MTTLLFTHKSTGNTFYLIPNNLFGFYSMNGDTVLTANGGAAVVVSESVDEVDRALMGIQGENNGISELSKRPGKGPSRRHGAAKKRKAGKK